MVDGGIFGYQKVNVNAQRRDPNSFMNWITRLIRVRKECMEISWGECEVIDCDADPVLVLVYRFRKAAMVSLHNFSDAAQTLHLKVRDKGGERLIDLIARGAQPRRPPRYPRDRARRLRLPLVPDRRRRRDTDPRGLLVSCRTRSGNQTKTKEAHCAGRGAGILVRNFFNYAEQTERDPPCHATR